MKNQKSISPNILKVVFYHNLAFLLFFFLTPKIYIFRDFGFRFEDILFPATFIIFLTALPEIKKLTYNKIHKAVIVYFAYIFIQGLILSFFTGAFKYFIVISAKQLQYFIFFYLLILTFQTNIFRRLTLNFITILVGANLAWALLQIFTGHQTLFRIDYYRVSVAYGIGAIGEKMPHQAAAIFLFCFLFSYFHRELKHRKFFIFLSAAAVFMTISRTTIAALLVCALYILLTSPEFRILFKKPLILLSSAIIFFFSVFAADTMLTSSNSRFYGTLKRRISSEAIHRGFFARITHWDHYLKDRHYIVHFPLNALTGMGRGYTNISGGGWKMKADSGYLRDFVEIGIIGLFMHLSIFFMIGRNTGFKRYMVILLPYLSLSITYEVFLMSKSGLILLVISAILLSDKSDNKTKAY